MGKGTNDARTNLSKSQYITLQEVQISKRVIEVVELELNASTARGVGRVCDTPTPRALQDLTVVVGHDHLGPEWRIDDPVVNRHGVVNDALDVVADP